MIASTLRQRFRGTAAALVILTCALRAGATYAADASQWAVDTRAGVRLIAGSPRAGDAALRAGVEIKLEPGWHTYWRYPGDSGVPPRFDFSKSENVKSIAVAWPAPHRLRDDGGTTIVYTDDVIFPLRVVPLDAAKPVTLRLKLDYAVCHDLCVPADADADLVLDGAPSTHDAALVAAEARVPKAARLGAPAALSVRAVRREASDDRARVIVDVAGPAPVDLFAEGPTPKWALPVPEPVAGAPAGQQRFALAIDGVPPGAKADGAILTFTLTTGAGAIEVKAPLD